MQYYFVAKSQNGEYVGYYTASHIAALLENGNIKSDYVATEATDVCYSDFIKITNRPHWKFVTDIVGAISDSNKHITGLIPTKRGAPKSETQEGLQGLLVCMMLLFMLGLGICIAIFIYHNIYPRSFENIFDSYENRLKTNALLLTSDYALNEIAADKKYKGRLVEISGQIQSIGKDTDGRPYIRLSGFNFSLGVECFIKNKATDAAATMRVGQLVILIGKEDGLMKMPDGRTANVVMRDCTFE